MSIFYSYPDFSNAQIFRNQNLTGIITEQGKQFISSDMTADLLDRLMEQGLSLKDSPTTTAALITLPGSETSAFLKRNNNKGFRFTCRYLFRPARVFHAAKAAVVFEQYGIKTPRVFMAAEKKKGLLLQSGYIITETIQNVKSVHHMLWGSDQPREIVDCFLPWAAKTVAKLHQLGIEHGDLKLVNFYCCGDWHDPESSCGIWDLDSVKIGKRVEPEKVNREIARIFFSFIYFMGKYDDCLDYTKEKCKEFCSMYQQYAPELYPPDTAQIIEKFEKRMISVLRKQKGSATC